MADFKDVTSSNIEAIAHDPDTKTLRVRFKGGAVYSYPDVEGHHYDSMLNADSVGGYFHKHIRNAYKGTKE